jgi:phosphoglucomutase
MEITDPVSGLSLGNPYSDPFNGLDFPGQPLKADSLGLILSPSGWRGVFAGGAEDDSEEIRPAMRWAALAMAAAAGEFFLKEISSGSQKSILIGCDSRPTGPGVAAIFMRLFAALGLKPEYLFIVAAPEIMAAARDSSRFGGFCYISASHNPVGHNGVKLGLNDGGVLSAEIAAAVIMRISSILASRDELRRLCLLQSSADPVYLESIYRASVEAKKDSARLYSEFSRLVLFEERPETEDFLRRALEAEPLGVVGELNGSARGSSIDDLFFSSIGLRCRLYNKQPRDIRHAILPEGDSLLPCRDLLMKAWREDPAFQAGYVPDNDGDRGNIVYIDPADGSGHVLEAQEVFALTCLAELAFSRIAGSADGADEAVVVNGPTSLRIDRIAEKFGVRVCRAEVGEANVVNLARRLRKEGTRVRILGEGSNGGTITHPAAVRDPLNSVCSLAKLLRYRDAQGRSPAEEWLKLAGYEYPSQTKITIPLLLRTLPSYRTTPSGEERARYPVRTSDHNLLKSRYERIFSAQWNRRPVLLEKLDIQGYRFVNYEGLTESRGPGGRSGSGRGGFKVELLGRDNKVSAFLWMRGSGTEALFRVMVDLPSSNAQDERDLISWHRGLLERADKEEL